MNEPSFLIRAIQAIGNLALSRVVAIAVIFTALYYFMIYDDGATLVNSIAASKAQLEVENKKKIETQKVLKKEQQMKSDVELFAKKFEEIKARIPIDFSESEMRAIVNQYATRNGLKTISTERRPPPAVSALANTAGAPITGESLVEQVILTYVFEGSYNNIAKFVSEVSNLEKIIKIADFNINLAPNPNAKVRTYDLTFRTNIIGYKQSLESLKNTKKADNASVK